MTPARPPTVSERDGERPEAVGLGVQDVKSDQSFAIRRAECMFAAMTETVLATRTDVVGPNSWGISDEVMQLREWGSGIAYPLPPKQGASIVGAAPDAWLRLWDPSGRISRRHAALTYAQGAWMMSDLDSKNGIHLDGVRVVSCCVLPGVEIRIGSTTLIAESPRFIALRALVERFMGWRDERRELVDQALFSIRVAATHREPLLLRGAGNLVPIARQLHQHVCGDRPFVAVTPQTRGMDALAAAAGGTLCVWRHQQPEDFDEVVAALRGPEACALLIVCAHALPRGNDIASQIVTAVRSIVIPPLADRARELPRIVEEYGADAVAAFGGGQMTPADHEWVASHAAGSLHQIAMATRRIVALHACDGSVTQAAKLLGMAHGSLSDWLARRTLPGRPSVAEDDDESESDA
jgi:hypothetical protein